MAIQSELNQSLQCFELDVVNDLSSDRSLEVAREMRKWDSRVRLFRDRTNAGTHRAWISAARRVHPVSQPGR
jgi:glycosyltransferase involved in cell wall biosynthesis